MVREGRLFNYGGVDIPLSIIKWLNFDTSTLLRLNLPPKPNSMPSLKLDPSEKPSHKAATHPQYKPFMPPSTIHLPGQIIFTSRFFSPRESLSRVVAATGAAAGGAISPVRGSIHHPQPQNSGGLRLVLLAQTFKSRLIGNVGVGLKC